MAPEKKGRMTLPVEKGMDRKLRELAQKWGVDAVRNSDGTELPENIRDLGLKIYSTLCMVRADQNWAKGGRERLQQKYLISDPVVAHSPRLTIDPMRGHFREQFEPDTLHDPKKWWEVTDRTSGKTVPKKRWSVDRRTGRVTIRGAEKYHTYTVSFLVFVIWDTTSMYNHITNNWTTPHQMIVDPRHPATRRRLREYLIRWLRNNPATDVVRLTSLAYHFTNNFSDQQKSKFIDWSAYHDTVSVTSINEFARAKGYRPRPEDFVDAGFLNDTNRVPSKRYLEWIDFNHKAITDVGKEWVDLIHSAGKEAMMFYCDHHIGSEPYGPHFKKMGLDGIVNPCGSGSEARRIADIPADIVKEVRLYPYFFPLGLWGEPIFAKGGNPKEECRRPWMNVRRALAQKLVDRIGFGGYPSLAAKYPDFVEYVTRLSDEFRALHDNTKQTKPYRPSFKVAVLNAWGAMRSWLGGPFTGGVLEALSGLSVDVEFMNFEDLLKKGVPEGVRVLINMGEAGTAWSGGRHWDDPKVVTALRDWVRRRGGGLIGVGDPSAFPKGGRYFQLWDLFGLDRKEGQGMNTRNPVAIEVPDHFILRDQPAPASLGWTKDRAYLIGRTAQVLAQQKVRVSPGPLQEGGDIYLAANRAGKGRAVYFAGLDYNPLNARLLLRAIFWAANRERELEKWFSSNPYAECVAYPKTRKLLVMNNSRQPQKTVVYGAGGKRRSVALKASESRWLPL